MFRKNTRAWLALVGIAAFVACGGPSSKGKAQEKEASGSGMDAEVVSLLEARISHSAYTVTSVKDDGTTITIELLMNFMPREAAPVGHLVSTQMESAIYYLRTTKYGGRKIDMAAYAKPENQNVRLLIGHCTYDPKENQINWFVAKDTTKTKS